MDNHDNMIYSCTADSGALRLARPISIRKKAPHYHAAEAWEYGRASVSRKRRYFGAPPKRSPRTDAPQIERPT